MHKSLSHELGMKYLCMGTLNFVCKFWDIWKEGGKLFSHNLQRKFFFRKIMQNFSVDPTSYVTGMLYVRTRRCTHTVVVFNHSYSGGGGG